MSFPVFLVEYLGAPRNHHAIFVQMNEKDESGYVFHVRGDIQNGMMYETKKGRRPEDSNTFVSKSYLGWVDDEDYYRVNEICSGIPPPKKQFQGPKRLYPKEPLRRCQEWTQEAVQALEASGVLQTLDPEAPLDLEAPLPEEYWVWSAEHGSYYHDNGDGTYEWANQGQGASSTPRTGSKGKGHGKGKDRARRK